MTDPAVISEAIEAALLNRWYCAPGIVSAYSAGSKTATVQPAVNRPIVDEDGSVSFEPCKPIPNVIVGHWGAASLSASFELAPGDVVLLLWCDFSTANWRKTGKVSDPGDARQSGPSYPIAIPLYRPSGGPGSDTTGESIGKPGGLRLHFADSAISAGNGAEFVALAALVMAQLNALKTQIAAAAVAEANAAGLGGMTALSSALAAAWPLPAGVASSNLKADP